MKNETQNSLEDQSFSDINITPFVDVVLVLLVIFMVAAPVMINNHFLINLPTSKNSDGATKSTLTIYIYQSGQYSLNGKLMTEQDLENEIKSIRKDNPSVQAVIAADKKSEHGYVIKIIDLLKSNQIENFAFEMEKSVRE
ncbi:MAG: biopolymer transporter ExbD [Bacteriovoracaceae bacterium]|nr:biopolymer transporter ExbD [Bacteriovoracaceae bacterium]